MITFQKISNANNYAFRTAVENCFRSFLYYEINMDDAYNEFI